MTWCRYGNWDRIRSSIRRCERFRFDYYLLSCSAETLGKRCEALMRMAEKELIEADKKKVSVAASSEGNASGGALGTLSVTVGMRERMAELSKQIAEEARRLASTRAELMRAKGVNTGAIPVAAEEMSASQSFGSGQKGKIIQKGKSTTDMPNSSESEPPRISHTGRPPVELTEDELPDLCR